MANDISHNRIFGNTRRRSPKRAASALAAPSLPKAAAASRDQIAKRAYEIWKATGCPHGRDKEHWLQAERELNPHSAR